MSGKLTAKERNMIARGTEKEQDKTDLRASIKSFVALILIFAGMAVLAWVVFYLLGAQNTAVPETIP